MDQHEVIGILSNWNRIEAELRIGIHDDFGQSKNIQDILDIIHDLQSIAGTVSPLRTLFTKHLSDNTNPHNVTFNLSDIEFFQFLYNEYVEKYGVIMTLPEFIEAFLDVKKFATRDDVDNLTNLDRVVNLDVANYIIERHDASPNAHNELFRYKLPGIPLPEPPAFVFEPAINFDTIIDVERRCSMNYIDINGRVKEAPANTLPIDFSYGIPSAPIFGEHRNSALNSRDLADIIPQGGSRISSNALFILTPSDDQNFFLFNESATPGKHGFRDNIIEELSGITSYTLFCYPLDRSALSINIYNSANELLGNAKINLVTLATEQFGSLGKLLADVQMLPNNWHRINIAFDASNQDISTIEVNTMFQDDHSTFGIEEYDGISCYSMGFWQRQITKTFLPVPPIFTTDNPVTVLGTKVRKNFTNIFNQTKGTVHLKYISPLPELSDVSSQLVRIGSNGINSIPLNTAINASTNPIAKDTIRIDSYNENYDVLATIHSEPYMTLSLVKRIVFSYTNGYHSYGFTDTPPKMFSHYDLNTGGDSVTTYDETIKSMMTLFENIYPGDPYSGVIIAQLDNEIIDGTPVNNDIVIPSADDILPQYRMNGNVNVIEIGYNSETNEYLNGYLLNFRYYTLFANKMNIEFLLDQYLPE